MENPNLKSTFSWDLELEFADMYHPLEDRRITL